MVITGNLNKTDSEFLNKNLTYNVPFAWTDNLVGDKNSYNPGGLHVIMHNSKVLSPLFNIINPYLQKILAKHKFNFKEYFRIRYFMQPDIKVSKEYKHDQIHIDDVDQPNYSLVYYINNAGGGTTIYETETPTYINHKMGHYVIFKGDIKHAGRISQNKTTRAVINVNFSINE